MRVCVCSRERVLEREKERALPRAGSRGAAAATALSARGGGTAGGGGRYARGVRRQLLRRRLSAPRYGAPPPVLLPSPSAPLPPVLLGRRADGGRKYDSFWARGATQRGVQLCAVCGFAAPYTCRVTGMRLCSKGCFKVHGETQLKGQ